MFRFARYFVAFANVAVIIAAIFMLLADGAGATPPLAPDPNGPPAPTNLRLNASSADGTVSLMWDAPQTNQIIDGYNIYRNGAYIDAVHGQAGVTPRVYTDTPPPSSTDLYAVQAVNAQHQPGQLSTSRQTTVSSANAAPQTVIKFAFGTNSLCSGLADLKPPPGSQPNAQEIYGCTPAMTTYTNNYDPGITNITDWGYLLASFPIIMLWSMAMLFNVLGTAFLNWSVSAGTYGSLSGFLGMLVSNLTGSPMFAHIVELALVSSPFFLGFYILKSQYRLTVTMLGVTLLAAGALAVGLGHSRSLVNTAVLAPVSIENYIVSSLDHWTTTGKPDLHGLTVVGTYRNLRPGDNNINVQRLADNEDWIIHSYLPACQYFTGDSHWATTTFIPPALQQTIGGNIAHTTGRLTFCETILWVENGTAYSGGFSNAVSSMTKFNSALKAANPGAYNVFSGRDLTTRYETSASTLAASFFHSLLKSILSALFIWLAFCLGLTIMALAVMLALTITGYKELANGLGRVFEKATYWTARAFIWSMMLLFVYVLENYVENWTSGHGANQETLASIIINIATIYAIFKLSKIRRRNKKVAKNYFAEQEKEQYRPPPPPAPNPTRPGVSSPEVISVPPVVMPSAPVGYNREHQLESGVSRIALTSPSTEIVTSSPYSDRHVFGPHVYSSNDSGAWKAEQIYPTEPESTEAVIIPRPYRPAVGSGSRLALPGRVIDVDPYDAELSSPHDADRSSPYDPEATSPYST